MVHIQPVEPSFQEEINKCEDSQDWLGNPTEHSRDILRKAKGDHLDRVLSDQVLEIIKQGKLVLVIRGQESQKQLTGSSGSSRLIR
jgi:hypothetical protein